MSTELKQKLHQLIDNCEDDLLLEEARVIFESPDIKDWWDDLTEEDKNLLMESEEQYQKGDFITHDQLMQQFNEWEKK